MNQKEEKGGAYLIFSVLKRVKGRPFARLTNEEEPI
jgi:hypothetical protein